MEMSEMAFPSPNDRLAACNAVCHSCAQWCGSRRALFRAAIGCL